jgi:hypothetical protein
MAHDRDAYDGSTVRRETFKNRGLEIAIIAIVIYSIALYTFDLPAG